MHAIAGLRFCKCSFGEHQSSWFRFGGGVRRRRYHYYIRNAYASGSYIRSWVGGNVGFLLTVTVTRKYRCFCHVLRTSRNCIENEIVQGILSESFMVGKYFSEPKKTTRSPPVGLGKSRATKIQPKAFLAIFSNHEKCRLEVGNDVISGVAEGRSTWMFHFTHFHAVFNCILQLTGSNYWRHIWQFCWADCLW